MKLPLIVLCLLSMTGPVPAEGPRSSVVDSLQARLERSDVSTVNAYLSAHWESDMASLGASVQRCNSDALKLSVRLLDTTNLEALQGHTYSLELAMGKCPEKLLPLIEMHQVGPLCAVNAFAEEHPAASLARELDRRMAALRKQRLAAGSKTGAACLDRYVERRKLVE